MRYSRSSLSRFPFFYCYGFFSTCRRAPSTPVSEIDFAFSCFADESFKIHLVTPGEITAIGVEGGIMNAALAAARSVDAGAESGIAAKRNEADSLNLTKTVPGPRGGAVMERT